LYLLASAHGFEDADITVYQVLGARLGSDHRLPLDRVELIAPARLEATQRSND
jgi:hypothetical protein